MPKVFPGEKRANEYQTRIGGWNSVSNMHSDRGIHNCNRFESHPRTNEPIPGLAVTVSECDELIDKGCDVMLNYNSDFRQ